MAYDEAIAERVRDLIALHGDVTERKMFGGVAWMVSGNMACGVIGEELIVRTGPEEHADALAQAGVREFDFTGKAMKGFVCVGEGAIAADSGLAGWVESGLAYASSLPAK